MLGFLRRCVYSDGFQEDITVNELQRLVRLEKTRKDVIFKKKETCKSESVKNNAGKQNNETEIQDSDEIDFEMADDIIPVDDTMESMLHFENQVNKDVDKLTYEDSKDEDSSWLTKVATLVNSKVTKSKQKSNSVTAINSVATSNTESDFGRHTEIDKPVPLSHIPKEKRRGCNVVCISDEKRIVGNVSVVFEELILRQSWSSFISPIFRTSKNSSY